MTDPETVGSMFRAAEMKQAEWRVQPPDARAGHVYTAHGPVSMQRHHV